MKSIVVASVTASLVAFAVVACSSGSSGGGGSGGAGGACGAYFDSYAAYTKQCGAVNFINSRDRWLTYCQLLVNAPGASGADGAINQCAQDVSAATSTCSPASKSTACSTFMGSLTAGAACGASVQCASSYCKVPSVQSSGTTATACGVCADKIAIGQPCNQEMGDTCVKGAICSQASSGTGSGTCKAQIVNDVGGACLGTDNATCKDDLRCDYTTKKCTALVAAGGTCKSDPDCATTLVCGSNLTCAQPMAEGAACTVPVDGFAPTGCARNATCSSTTKTCTSSTLVDAGGVCDYATKHYCRVGSCNTSVGDAGSSGPPTGICPTIIADGQACNATAKDTTCDAYADCIGGKCTLFDPSSCK